MEKIGAAMATEHYATILGDEELVFVDVGASYFIPDTWNIFLSLPRAKFVLFDPNGQNLNYAAHLPPERFSIVPRALAVEEGFAELFIANVDSGSSLLPPHQWPGRPDISADYFFPLRIVDIETRTLASCMKDLQLTNLHAIKLDTQGSELDIVKGMGSKLLAGVLLVEMEVTMDSYPVMFGSPKLPEVISFFEAAGFRYVNTRIARRPPAVSRVSGRKFASTIGVQHECDVLFIRDIVNAVYSGPVELLQVVRQQVSLLAAYYLHAEALEILHLVSNRLPQYQSEILAIECAIENIAEHQVTQLECGALSLWHRDQT